MRRRQLYVTCRRIGSTLSDARYRDFWKEVCLLKRNTCGSHCNHSSIDGLSSNNDIASAFAYKLKQLPKSSSDPSVYDRLSAELDSMIVSSDLASVSVSPAIVSEALSLLKHGKGDGSNLSSDHFLFCSEVIMPFLSQLFTCMIRHGYVPSVLRNCVLQPLLKPGKDPCKSDNYRPIALAPTLSKMFERCILIMYNSAFFTFPLQFGFKKGCSTTLCSGLIKNVISRYVYRGLRVFGCFLDASKAFDCVDHHALFQKLLRRNLPPVVVWLLLFWYQKQSLQVRWQSTLSEHFGVSNGVRQDGVLSPILFTVYIDDLLLDLHQLGVGCFWNQHFVGAVCYANDVALVAPSPCALRLMLNNLPSSILLNLMPIRRNSFVLVVLFNALLTFSFLGTL